MQGDIGKTRGLKFTVDTGARFSLLDAGVIKRLGLIAESQGSRILSLDTVTTPNRVLVTDLRLGPISASLYFLQADLSDWGVDGMIGLDLLRRQGCLTDPKPHETLKNNKLTLDFQSRTIRFGRSQRLEYSVPIENDPRQIIVTAKILNRPLRLVVDTGADMTTLFGKPDSIWIDTLPFVQSTVLPTLDGEGRARQVELPNLELGNCHWGWTPGLVISTRLQPTDGLLSIHTLRLKILHFDFDCSTIKTSALR